MEALIDTNVILTYLTDRNTPDHDACIRIMQLCANGAINGSVAFHTLSNIWYILQKTVLKDQRRELLLDLVTILNVTGASAEKVKEAIAWEDFQDFEDCLQYECAKEASAAYIITSNGKDFAAASDIKILTPAEAIALLESRSTEVPQ